MSIRLRLSLLYSAILVLVMVIVGIVLYTTQSQYTLSWLKQDLVISSETLSQSIIQNYLNPKLPGSGGQVSTPPPALNLTNDQTFQYQSQQEIVRVLDPDGALIASPLGTNEINLPLDALGLQAVRSQQDWWADDSVAGIHLLIYSRPVIFQNQVISILQVARAQTERDQSLQSLGYTLLIATLIAVLVAVGAGWILAREALRPIRQISKTAQAIGSQRDFTRRVAHTGPQDEVGQLALTFNSMVTQLEDAYRQLGQSLEMQRNFVADVSHELRTPLTTLRGNLGLLSRTPSLPEADQTDILNDLVEESDRLIRLVNELLTLARADAGRSLAKEVVPVSEVIEETCRQARQLAPERQITLDIAPEMAVTGDRDAIKQVLVILLDNALKHARGRIMLSGEVANKHVTIRVQDGGPGIPQDQLAHVFERFYRGEDRINIPGLGLGLPIAKALVEGQGGTIWIESEVGKGTTTFISFPAA